LICVEIGDGDGGVRDYSARSISNRPGERAGSGSLRKGSRHENHGETNQSKTNRGNYTRAGGTRSSPDHFHFPLNVDFIRAESPYIAGPDYACNARGGMDSLLRRAPSDAAYSSQYEAMSNTFLNLKVFGRIAVPIHDPLGVAVQAGFLRWEKAIAETSLKLKHLGPETPSSEPALIRANRWI
jgi:hypothetical protein